MSFFLSLGFAQVAQDSLIDGTRVDEENLRTLMYEKVRPIEERIKETQTFIERSRALIPQKF